MDRCRRQATASASRLTFRGLLHRSGGPGDVEGWDHLFREAVEVVELHVERGRGDDAVEAGVAFLDCLSAPMMSTPHPRSSQFDVPTRRGSRSAATCSCSRPAPSAIRRIYSCSVNNGFPIITPWPGLTRPSKSSTFAKKRRGCPDQARARGSTFFSDWYNAGAWRIACSRGDAIWKWIAER